jgi:hypothetical protein
MVKNSGFLLLFLKIKNPKNICKIKNTKRFLDIFNFRGRNSEKNKIQNSKMLLKKNKQMRII